MEKRLRLLALLLLCSLAGCVAPSVPPPDVGGADWTVRQGQAVWQPRGGMSPIAGELVLATSAGGDFVVEFSKTPLTVARAHRHGPRWQVDFPAQPRRLGGQGSPTTRVLWCWLAPALEGAGLPRGVQFSREAGSGNWRLENTRTGESLEGFLTP